MTQNELAVKLGYSRSLVAALETDQRLPDVDSVARTFVPALGLVESPGLVAQLVQLAALARNERPPAAFAVDTTADTRQHRSIHVEEAQASYRIPVAPTKLLGRDREIDRLCDRFLEQHARLLTLVGPPGVGKTRLAQAVGVRLQVFFADGACYVPLAAVTDPDALIASLATALDVRFGLGRPALDRVVTHLRHKEILILLDNFEQILPAAPQLAHLLAECAGVRLLATSRERLHLRAEHVARVSPLPPAAAVELFLQRASAVDPGFTLADANRGVIEAICRRLDYLPLSIELCAAQADFFTAKQLLERVQLRLLDALADGAADLPPGRSTLRASIQASYDLLGADERSLLCALSVFAGGCELAMVEQVCPGDPAHPGSPPSDALRALAAKNLVQIETTPEVGRRFMLLESVREFARERLQLEGDLQAIHARHFDAYLQFTRVADAQLRRPEATIWVKRLDLELDNIRAALQWSYETGRYQEFAWLVLAVQYYWHQRGLLDEGANWIEPLLPHCHVLDADTHLGIKLTYIYKAVTLPRRDKVRLAMQEVIALVDGCKEPLVKSNAWRWMALLAPDMVGVSEAFRHSVQLARDGRNSPEAVKVFGIQADRDVLLPKNLWTYASYLIDHAETVESAALTSESLALYRAVGNRGGAAFAVGNLGRLALLNGDAGQARAYFQEAVDAATDLADLNAICHWQPRLALATLYAGDVEAAHRLLAGSLDACREFGDPQLLARTCGYLAEAELWAGRIEEAQRWLAESLAHDAGPQDATVFQIRRVLIAARLAAAGEQDQRAASLFGLAAAMSDRIHFEPPAPMQCPAEASAAQVRARLGEGPFCGAYEIGQRLAFAEAVAGL